MSEGQTHVPSATPRLRYPSGRRVTDFHLRVYRQAGIADAEIPAWVDAGIGHYEAERYLSLGLDLAEAAELKRRGVSGSIAAGVEVPEGADAFDVILPQADRLLEAQRQAEEARRAAEEARRAEEEARRAEEERRRIEEEEQRRIEEEEQRLALVRAVRIERNGGQPVDLIEGSRLLELVMQLELRGYRVVMDDALIAQEFVW